MYGLLNWWNVPWCVGGDFNVICFPTKLLGTENYSQVMFDFFDFISTYGTIDLPLEGDSFTWSSTRKQVDLELTAFCSQWIKRFSSQMFINEGCPTLCLTTFQFSKIVVVSKEAIILLDLKT